MISTRRLCFHELTFDDFVRIFQVDYVGKSNDLIFVSLDANGNILLSGNTYHWREKIKHVISKNGVNLQWDANVKAWRIFTGQNPKKIAHIMDDLRNYIRCIYFVFRRDVELPRKRELLTTLNGYTLFPYQVEGIAAIVKAYDAKKQAFLLADDPGLGKTLQALGACKVLGKDAVAIVPTSIITQWQVIAQECGVNVQVFNYTQAEKADVNGKILILDEAHYLKNNRTQRAEKIREIAKHADFVIALTGTPVMNRIDELANLFFVLHILNSKQWFLKTFTTPVEESFYSKAIERPMVKVTYEVNEEQVGKIKNFLENNIAYLRRTKREVGMQLPETMRIPIIIEADAKEAREELIKAAIKEALKRNIDVSLFYSEDFVADFVLDLQGSCIFEARRLYAIAKAEKAAKYLKYLSEGIDQPLIVFFHHREVLEILMSEVDGSYIDGTVSEKRRAEIVDQFQKGNIKVLYLSLKTGSLGLNLTATDTVVFVEYDWVPANLLQAEARVNRIGQKSETIFAYYLTTTDQIERRILDRLFYKAQLCYRLLGGEEFHI